MGGVRSGSLLVIAALFWWEGKAAAAPTADYNADGMLTVTDVQCCILVTLWSLAGATGAPPSCLAIPLASADVNSDGAVNVSDIQIVIAAVLSGVDVVGPAAPSVYDVQQGLVALGTDLVLEDLVVTGVAKTVAGVGYGIFVQDPAGGPYSGVWVYTATGAQMFSRGQRVRVAGRVTEFDSFGTWPDSVTQLDASLSGGVAAGSVLATGFAGEPTPEVVSLGAFAQAATIEPYEGVLVAVENVAVVNPNLGFGEWSVTGGIVIDDKLFALGTVSLGQSFESIVGVLDYSHGSYKLQPRDAADFETGPAPTIGVAEAPAGSVIISEIMIDPGSGCSDTSDEYVELRNVSASAIDLKGLTLTWGTSSTTLTAPLIVEPGAYAVGVRKSPSPCYEHFGDFVFPLSLTNTGRIFSLSRPDGAVLDTVDFTGWTKITSGLALGVDPTKANSVDNDNQTNWCQQTTSLRIDRGTPGLRNDSCAPPPSPPTDPTLCTGATNCAAPNTCVGITASPTGPKGSCVSPVMPSGAGQNCHTDIDCGDGLVCVGAIRFAPDPGQCQPAWMSKTFTVAQSFVLPAGGTFTKSGVTAYGLASVPVDVVVHFDLHHPRPEDLTILLRDPVGDIAQIWAPGQGINGSITVAAVCCISGDESPLGTWWLEITDTGVGGPGILEGWSLKVSSRYD